MSTRKGFTLMEMVLVIAVIAILILAIQGGSGIRETARVQSAAESVRALRSAAESYIGGGKLSFSGISIEILKTRGLLPSGFDAGASNPWGGSYSLSANEADSGKIDVVLTSVPDSAHERLNELFKNSASATAYSDGRWRATF